MPDATQLDLLKTLMQAYQGQANLAGPYFNLASIFQPGYGQTGLTNQQQQMFGYNVGPAGGIGSPATPAGGFFGSPQSGLPGYGPQPSGGGYPPATPVPDTGGFNPYAGSGGTPGGGSYPNGPALYSPPNGTAIGAGNDFNNPYNGVFGPGQTPGYHPGTLDLNTTALASFGPLATAGLLQANPYLADALNLQNAAAFNAAVPSDNLNTLTQMAGDQLALGGHMSAADIRAKQQETLGSFASSGIAHGNSSIVADILSRSAAEQQRLQQAQAFASGVEGLSFQQQGLAGSLAGQAANTATSSLTNPFMQILGLGSLNSTSNPSTAISDQGQMTNPFLQAGLDVAGANFNAQNAANIANSNQDAATNAGWMSLAGDVFGGLFSDERLKTDIRKTGRKTKQGAPIKSFRYKTDPQKRRFVGVMAQDVEKSNPYAVMTDAVSGVKAVDYAKAEAPFYEVNNPYRKAA